MKTLHLIWWLFQHPETKKVFFVSKHTTENDGITPIQAIEHLSAYWDIDEKTNWRINCDGINNELMIYIIE